MSRIGRAQDGGGRRWVWAAGAATFALHCGGAAAPSAAVDAAVSGDAGATLEGGADGGGGDADQDVATPPCVPGAACTPNGNECQTGTTACPSGREVCASVANVPDGTACGANQVCAGGICGACVAGITCNPGGNACQAGVTSCSTGVSTCVPMGNLANGTPCGTGEVCLEGACGACVAGASCTPDGNPCQTGTTSCSAGEATCVPTGDVADGTACAVGICCGGTCAACSAPPPNEVVTCSVKTCTFACKSGYSRCGGECVDTTSNSSACGPSCAVCPAGTSCVNSQCNTLLFGYSTEFAPCGGATSAISPNVLWGQQVSISTAITVTALGVFGNSPAPGVHAILALYSDSGTTPARPSRQKAVTASTLISNGDNRIPVLGQPMLPAGTYWIMAEYDATAAVCADDTSTNAQAYVLVNYGTVPDPFAESDGGAPVVQTGVDFNYYVVGNR